VACDRGLLLELWKNGSGGEERKRVFVCSRAQLWRKRGVVSGSLEQPRSNLPGRREKKRGGGRGREGNIYVLPLDFALDLPMKRKTTESAKGSHFP